MADLSEEEKEALGNALSLSLSLSLSLISYR